MASKKDKNSRSNKTAHVLNLITTPAQRQAAQKQAEAESAAQEGIPDPEAAAEPAAAPSRPLTPPVIEVAHSQDEKIADQIRSALNDELAQLANDPELGGAPAATTPPAPFSAPNFSEGLDTPVHDFLGKTNPAVASDPLAAEVASALEEAAETPVHEEVSAATEVPVHEEIPVAAEVPVHEEVPAAAEVPVHEEVPAAVEVPVHEEVPAAAQVPVHEEVPAAVEVPVHEEIPVTAEIPVHAEVPAAVEVPVHEEVPAAAEIPVHEVPPVAPVHAAAAPMAGPAPFSTSIEFEPTRPAQRGPAPTPHSGSDLLYVNIMQTMVEAMAPRYIKMFGVCKCSRCSADVKALTLTNLTPKYAVFHRRDRVPMLTVYENRYGSLIAAELTKACSIVKLNPHHR